MTSWEAGLYRIVVLKKGHFGVVCFSSKAIANVVETEEPEGAYLDTLHAGQAGSWTTTINVNGKPTEIKVDTGAEVTAPSESTF